MFVVYVHIVPNNKLYFGITQNVKNRWRDGIGYQNQQLFWRAIKKYGWNNIKHIILIENVSKDIACECEKYLIEKYNTTNPKFGYNVSVGGDGPFGVVRSNETREKLRLANLGHKHSKETIEKIKLHHAHLNRGKKLTSEQKEKLLNSRRGKSSWCKGKKFTEEHRKKLSDAHRGKPAHNKGQHCSAEMKRKVSLANTGKIPWNKGKTTDDAIKQKISNSLKGRIWVNNGASRTLINKNNLSEYIENGYVLGKLLKK